MTVSSRPYNASAVYKRRMTVESTRDEHEHRQPGAARRQVTRIRPVHVQDAEPVYGLDDALTDLDSENRRLRELVEEQARQIRWLRLVARMG